MTSIALLAVALVLGGAFAYAYNAYSNEVSTANQISNERQALQAELAATEANVTSLMTQRAQLQLQLQQDTANITAGSAQRDMLESRVVSLNSEISSLNSQIGTLNSTVNNLQKTLSLSNQTVLVRNITLVLSPPIPCPGKNITGCYVPSSTGLVNFTADYSGFILVTYNTNFTSGCSGDCPDDWFTIHSISNVTADNLACGYYILKNGVNYGFGNVGCVDQIIPIGIGGSIPVQRIVGVLPGAVEIFLNNNSSQGLHATVTLSITYYN
jgi:hypothetical protein